MIRLGLSFGAPAGMVAALALVSCGGPEASGNGPEGDEAAAGAVSATPLAAAREGSWINISGRVVSTLPSSFLLDHGRGQLVVEMDDWDWYQEGQLLKPGDEVVVTGRVDKELPGENTLEARSVYAKSLNTYFIASGADEESLRKSSVYRPRGQGYVDAMGPVIAVDGRSFALGPASAPLRVDTSLLSENPLDRIGFQQIKAGDDVYVWGDLDTGNGMSREINARGIVTIATDKSKRS